MNSVISDTLTNLNRLLLVVLGKRTEWEAKFTVTRFGLNGLHASLTDDGAYQIRVNCKDGENYINVAGGYHVLTIKFNAQKVRIAEMLWGETEEQIIEIDDEDYGRINTTYWLIDHIIEAL